MAIKEIPGRPEIKPNGKDAKGKFLPGHNYGTGFTKPGNPYGQPLKRLSGRHWMRRALEIPEEEWPAVAFCAADRNARKLVKELNKLKGKDYVSALSTAHHDAYGQEARIEVQTSPGVEEANAEIARIEAEIQRLLKGGK